MKKEKVNTTVLLEKDLREELEKEGKENERDLSKHLRWIIKNRKKNDGQVNES